MASSTLIVEQPAVRPAVVPSSSAVSWGAVLAGAVAAAAMSLALLFLCAAAGLSMVSPWGGYGASATTFAVSGAIGMILVQWIASGLGGYLTGRLRQRYEGAGDDEVFFRDTANGFLAWCVGTLIVAVVVTATAMGAARTGAQAVATVAAGAASGAAGAAQRAGGPDTDATAYFVDVLFRGSTPGAPAGPDARAEVTRILLRSAAQGEMAAADRTYVAQRIAQAAGIPEEEAQRRLQEIEAQASAAKAQAQQAADQARKAAALGSLFTFLSLMVGAFIAAVAAAFGATFRDDRVTA